MEVDYSNRLILAPMVRVGTLPFRLLSSECGADITYSEELIALKLMKCKRVVNEKKQTIDFVAPDNTIAYQTSLLDQHNVNIVQLGAANSSTALDAATVLAKDVAGFDLNCGCPKHFSVQGNMGAALLKTPETIQDIVQTLERNVDKPVTIKIRLLEKDSDTVEIIRRAEHVGARAVAIHARFVHERPRDRAHWDRLAQVIELAGSAVSVPLIANGDIHSPEDVAKVKELKGISSVMIARGAINDVSIFAKAKALEKKPKKIAESKEEEEKEITEQPVKIFSTRIDAVKRYLQWTMKTGNTLPNTKYVIKTMVEVPGGFNGATMPPDHTLWNQVTSAKSHADLCNTWGVEIPNEKNHQDTELTDPER